ncbi:MAG: hypothetical protein MZV64_34175 [Ignavibacteriales bacterium]|nr:hypothetical protein [Ignavibacteriales bacterium]
MGSLSDLLGHLPQVGPLKNLAKAQVDEPQDRPLRGHHRFHDARRSGPTRRSSTAAAGPASPAAAAGRSTRSTSW